jgi:uncharacterized membrane protein
LSFGLSIAVVPLIGLGLNYTPWGIRLVPVIVSLCIFTIVMAYIAHYRRAELPAQDRFALEFRQYLESAQNEFEPSNRTSLDKALTILLILSIVASIEALIYVIVTPKQGEKFTEFYILGPGGMAYGYPASVQAGNTSTVNVGIVNHEYNTVNYTLETAFDNITFFKRNLTLQHNQTWEGPFSYKLYEPGDKQKLQFLLYKDKNFSGPYRELHLWVNVSENRIS